jgi:hypothetical protein
MVLSPTRQRAAEAFISHFLVCENHVLTCLDVFPSVAHWNRHTLEMSSRWLFPKEEIDKPVRPGGTSPRTALKLRAEAAKFIRQLGSIEYLDMYPRNINSIFCTLVLF